MRLIRETTTLQVSLVSPLSKEEIEMYNSHDSAFLYQL